MRGITLFSKNAGIEVMGNNLVKKSKRFGIVTLRFFELTNGGKQMRFIVSPPESYEIGLITTKVLESAKALKLSKTHKFVKSGQEISTVLSLEKWAKDSKVGYAVSIKRDSESINVPMTAATFAYFGEFLKYLSTQQAWVNPADDEKEVSEEVSTEEDPNDLDVFDDDFYGEPDAPASDPDDLDDYEPAPEPTPPEPTPTPIDGDVRTSGVLEAVRNDKKGFKLDGQWITINEHTKVTGVLKKGAFVTVDYRNGNSGGKFANVVVVS